MFNLSLQFLIFLLPSHIFDFREFLFSTQRKPFFYLIIVPHSPFFSVFPVSRVPFPVFRFQFQSLSVLRFPFPVLSFPFRVLHFPFSVPVALSSSFPVSRSSFPVPRLRFPFSVPVALSSSFPVPRFFFFRFSISVFCFLFSASCLSLFFVNVIVFLPFLQVKL